MLLPSLALWSTLILVGGTVLFSYLRTKEIRSKLRDCFFTSKNVEPEVSYGGTSFYASIPKNTTRKTLFGYGPKTKVSEIEIEVLNKGTNNKNRFTLTKDSPDANHQITPRKPYGYKWRTREDDLAWSEWSDPVSFVSEPAPFRILPGDPSRNKSEIIKDIEGGACFRTLVVGKPGAGKSRFINRLASAIAGTLKFLAKTAPGGLTTTQRLTEHELISKKAFIYDMPGWEESFGTNLLRLALEGQLDEVTVRRLRGDFFGANDARNAQQTEGGILMPRIDVILLVMSATELETNLGFHQQLLNVFNRLEIPCIGIITKVDSIVSKEDQPVSLEKFYEDSRVIKMCEQVPLDMKFPLANPPSRTLDAGVDELMLQILRTAQEMSQADS